MILLLSHLMKRTLRNSLIAYLHLRTVNKKGIGEVHLRAHLCLLLMKSKRKRQICRWTNYQ